MSVDPRISDDDQRLSVVANAIGFEMLRHDGRFACVGEHGVEQIAVTDNEIERCRAAAKRVLEHLATWDERTGAPDLHDELETHRGVAKRLRDGYLPVRSVYDQTTGRWHQPGTDDTDDDPMTPEQFRAVWPEERSR